MIIEVFVISKESFRFNDSQGVSEIYFEKEDIALEYLSKLEQYYSDENRIPGVEIEKYDDGFEVDSNGKWSYEFKIFKRNIEIHEKIINEIVL